MKKKLLITLFLALCWANAVAQEKEVFQSLTALSDIQQVRYLMDEAYYNAMYFDDQSKIANIDSLLNSLAVNVGKYAKYNNKLTYCTYTVRELTDLWVLKKTVLMGDKSEDLAKGIKPILKKEETVNQYLMYCINNVKKLL